MSDDALPEPSEWYCDTCGDTITDPNMSLVVWKPARDGDHSFRVVHKGKCDPGSKGPGAYMYSLDISSFLGGHGRAFLLSMLSPGPILVARGSEGVPPKDRHEYFDLFNRMQTPYYEEGRRHFTCPGLLDMLYDVNEYYPYLPETLERVPSHDGECNWD